MAKQFYFKQFSLALVRNLNIKRVLFQVIQFSSTWSIDRTLSGATTPGQSKPGSDGYKGVLYIPHSSSIIRTSPSDRLVSYTGHSLWESYFSVEKQLVYFTVQADRARLDSLEETYTSAETQSVYSTVHTDYSNNERIIFWVQCSRRMSFSNYPYHWYNEDNYQMLIRIFHSFQDRSIDIASYCFYWRNLLIVGLFLSLILLLFFLFLLNNIFHLLIHSFCHPFIFSFIHSLIHAFRH